MNDDTYGQASAQYFTVTSDDQEFSVQLQLTEEQRSRWDYLLSLIDQAETSSLVARWVAMADGYLLGLRDAGAITPNQCDQLTEQLKSRETEQAHRVSPK